MFERPFFLNLHLLHITTPHAIVPESAQQSNATFTFS